MNSVIYYRDSRKDARTNRNPTVKEGGTRPHIKVFLFNCVERSTLAYARASVYSCKKISLRLGVPAAKCFIILFLFCQISAAQDDQPDNVAPPPLKIISKAEKSQIDAATEVKPRTKLSLELMDARLLKAEDYAKQEKYDEMFEELGGFHGLMDNTVYFLVKSDAKQKKVLDEFKRVELALRKYVTRLELIRRDLPIRYEFYVRKLVKYAREARTRAIEPMFGDTVLPAKKTQ